MFRVVMGSLIAAAVGLAGGCATESHQTVQPQQVVKREYSGPKVPLVIGKFENRSPYMRGIFSDGTDKLGLQAKQILKTHLSDTNRFAVVDRDNMDQLGTEAKIGGTTQTVTGAKLLLTGAVTEFGRRETGTKAAGGLFGKSKKQTAYAKVSVSIVDVGTSQVLFSSQGAGEYEMSNAEVLGSGGTAGYDATLNDKVLNLAIIECVNRLVDGMEAGALGRP